MTRTLLLAEAAQVDDVDVGRRLITGITVPYGQPGRTNLGHGLAVRAGAVRLREPHRRVMGLYGHRPAYGEAPKPYPDGHAVARMVAYEDGPKLLRAQYRVARTQLGDQLLAEAADGVRSSLSIELDDVQTDPYGSEIVAGLWEFSAFVPLGAFDDAQITSVAAQAHPTGAPVYRRPQFARQFIEVGGGQQVQQQPVQQVQQQAPVGPAQLWTPPGQPQQVQAQQPQQQADPQAWWLQQPVQPQQVQQQAAQQPQQQLVPQLQAQQAQAQQGQVVQLSPEQFQQLMAGAGAQNAQLQAQQAQQPAVLPGGLPMGAQQQQADAQAKSGHVLKAAQLQAAMVRGDRSPQLLAALADITNTGLDLFQSPAQAIGQELWSGGGYTRRFVQLMSPKQLTSWKFGGWRWVNRPEVDDYAGDKAEIPTNEVSVEPIAGEAERVAGGWDIDRKFRDFGDTEFWTGFYQAQTESYAEVTDLKAAAFIVSKARAITANANVPAGYVGSNVAQADVLRAAALGSAILEDTPNVRRPADYVLMNTGDWLSLMDFTGLELPAFLAMLGVKPEQFQRTSEVPSGSVVLGVTPALSHYELGGGAPIRVEALDVARAGIDSAVYGYVGHLENRPGGVISVPLTPPVAP